jgi:hypothetical protein
MESGEKTSKTTTEVKGERTRMEGSQANNCANKKGKGKTR